MASRSPFVVPAAAILVAICAGCAASHPPLASQAIAPGIAPRQTNPNAPYMVPAARPQPKLSPAPQTAADAPPCNPAVLSVEEIAGNANGIFRSVKLAFRNRGSLPCRLAGYPTVALLGARGETLSSIAMEKIASAGARAELSQARSPAAAGPSPQVTLMPHAVAAFQVVWTTAPECPAISRLVVKAPGTGRTFAVTQPMKVCSGRMQVTDLEPDQGDD